MDKLVENAAKFISQQKLQENIISNIGNRMSVNQANAKIAAEHENREKKVYRTNWHNDFSIEEKVFASVAKGGNWSPKMKSDGTITDRADLTHVLAASSWLRTNKNARIHPKGSIEGAETARAAWISAIHALPDHFQTSERNENAAQGPKIDSLSRWMHSKGKSPDEIKQMIDYDYKAHTNWVEAFQKTRSMR